MLKLILIGESGVGKTSLIQRYVMNKFEPTYKTTIGCDFLAKTVYVENKEYNLQIWDTAGHEKFSSMVSSFYRGSDGAIIVFDVTNTSSFTAIDTWISEYSRALNGKDVPIIICGNKVDCQPRLVSTESARQWCEGRNYSYIETSAATAQGVNDLFMEVVKVIIENKEDDNGDDLNPVPIALETKSESGCC
ncbi:Rab family GTPase [Entamoeba histolytica HM-1:IMSS-B]|uniref:Rab family GTPase n=6 Tax=Entamoeba histolytica TaxID=5759 RepID=A0A8U0WPC1_ENTH1|nr:Rab family GTPase [Entamoeba histolytica HM-1:IMSS]EMD47807.1 Rab family gtpase [Entamoeba histolytica KU27]EMH77129.1 Rab family GTPase [Entamoeba histolytica HM-1:IMSS-B]EMS10772.1 Rab family GTPase [Entamoeba histolytica HM-3:IMSS]ENY62759.1 Rab family GTPase, putative [Entamoeba histolytica HM-1:IMSS-A]BAD34974.1 EhRab7G protein [Entamoeba histolytica]|eukprot:XP_656477.1 Rab family GTPase [Entamoeba histolytica HM-1:IMSS]